MRWSTIMIFTLEWRPSLAFITARVCVHLLSVQHSWGKCQPPFSLLCLPAAQVHPTLRATRFEIKSWAVKTKLTGKARKCFTQTLIKLTDWIQCWYKNFNNAAESTELWWRRTHDTRENEVIKFYQFILVSNYIKSFRLQFYSWKHGERGWRILQICTRKSR